MSTAQTSQLNIIVVDDQDDLRRVLKDLLALSNCRVEAVPDGETAQQMMRSDEFDVLITDIGLPGMSGWDLAQWARRRNHKLKIIVISSWKGEEAEPKQSRFDIARVIRKPFLFDDILETINQLYPSHKSDRIGLHAGKIG